MANEKRLIDANAFQFEPDPVDNIMNGVLFLGRSTGKTLQQVKYCLKAMIENAPTVDAVPVVHGRWVQKEFWPGGGTWRCSECGYQVMFMEDTPATKKMHYCPNCGAKMDGGNDNGC